MMYYSLLYEELNNIKSDPNFWRSLRLIDALKVDFKEFQCNKMNGIDIKYGMSSIMISIKGIVICVYFHAIQFKLYVFIVMQIFAPPSVMLPLLLRSTVWTRNLRLTINYIPLSCLMLHFIKHMH